MLILTAEKWRFVPIGECTWENGRHVHERGLSMCIETSLYPTVSVAVTAPLAAPRCRTGKSEVDGSDPPFLPPGSAMRVRLMCTAVPIAWEGRSRPLNPWREGPDDTGGRPWEPGAVASELPDDSWSATVLEVNERREDYVLDGDSGKGQIGNRRHLMLRSLLRG